MADNAQSDERTECDRCGSDFRIELCAVAENPTGLDRDRVEAYLCYKCRRETTHERLEAL